MHVLVVLTQSLGQVTPLLVYQPVKLAQLVTNAMTLPYLPNNVFQVLTRQVLAKHPVTVAAVELTHSLLKRNATLHQQVTSLLQLLQFPECAHPVLTQAQAHLAAQPQLLIITHLLVLKQTGTAHGVSTVFQVEMVVSKRKDPSLTPVMEIVQPVVTTFQFLMAGLVEVQLPNAMLDTTVHTVL
jgi:hypothetical protein